MRAIRATSPWICEVYGRPWGQNHENGGLISRYLLDLDRSDHSDRISNLFSAKRFSNFGSLRNHEYLNQWFKHPPYPPVPPRRGGTGVPRVWRGGTGGSEPGKSREIARFWSFFGTILGFLVEKFQKLVLKGGYGGPPGSV